MGNSVDALADVLTPSNPSVNWRQVVVVSVDSAYSITAQYPGSTSTVAGIKYFSHVNPKVGASVWLAKLGDTDWIAVGTVASQAGTPFARIRSTNNQSLTSGVLLDVTLDTVVHDPWSMIYNSGGLYGLQVPLTGLWDVSGQVQLTGTNFTGATRRAYIRSDSSGTQTIWALNQVPPPSTGSSSVNINVSTTVSVLENDVIVLTCSADFAGAPTVTTITTGSWLTAKYAGAV